MICEELTTDPTHEVNAFEELRDKNPKLGEETVNIGYMTRGMKDAPKCDCGETQRHIVDENCNRKFPTTWKVLTNPNEYGYTILNLVQLIK